jgi:hypothetical protein
MSVSATKTDASTSLTERLQAAGLRQVDIEAVLSAVKAAETKRSSGSKFTVTKALGHDGFSD